jgi:hypothetical protein
MIISLGSRPARVRGVCKVKQATAPAQVRVKEQDVRVDGPSGENPTRVCIYNNRRALHPALSLRLQQTGHDNGEKRERRERPRTRVRHGRLSPSRPPSLVLLLSVCLILALSVKTRKGL